MLHTCYIFLMWIVPCKVELTKEVIATQESSFGKANILVYSVKMAAISYKSEE